MDFEATEMIALSMGPPPKEGLPCPAAGRILTEAGADRLTRAWVAYWLGPGFTQQVPASDKQEDTVTGALPDSARVKASLKSWN